MINIINSYSLMNEFYLILFSLFFISGIIYISNEAKKEINYKIIKFNEKYIRILQEYDI